MIRVAVQEAYLTGTDIVNEKVTDRNKDFQTFISISDVENIRSLTERLNDNFWTTAARLLRREQEFTINLADNKEMIKKKSFDDIAAMTVLAVSVGFLPYNSAVVNKMRNIPVLSTQQQQVSLDVGYDIFRLPEELPLEGQVMFLTQEDVKVDPEICEPLNRTVYDVNDPDLPIPIQDTHLHCRCRLIPIVSGEPITEV